MSNRSLGALCLLAGVLLMSGCAARPVSSVVSSAEKKLAPETEETENHVDKPGEATPATEVRPHVGVESCDRELKALRKIDAGKYARRKVQFDRLMSGAAVYSGIRSDVLDGTRDAMDAMYRFRTGKLCSEISRDVLESLARLGDRVDIDNK
ncbi:hypothetical protein ID80_004637 [Salmonella enterica subsp. enterica serovar Ball]|nr:hypothetical protein [Salmonella enterica subsp. enterica serovar Ball]